MRTACSHAVVSHSCTTVPLDKPHSPLFRTIRKTETLWGVQLQLYLLTPYHDARLALSPSVPPPTSPATNFSVLRTEILNDAQWRVATADQPWTAATRRRLVSRFLGAKMRHSDVALQMEGLHGLWELAINRSVHSDIARGALINKQNDWGSCRG